MPKIFEGVASVTRLVGLAENFCSKISPPPNIGNLLRYFEKCHFEVKTAVATFCATFGENGLVFLTSGHTALLVAHIPNINVDFRGQR